MLENYFTTIIDVDGCSGREHFPVEFVELSRVIVCPISEPGNTSNEVKCVMKGVHDLLLGEFPLSDLRNFRISIGEILESLIHRLKLFLRHEGNDSIFTH